MNPLRIAVFGAGHLGRIHAKLLPSVEHAELVAVVEPLAAARQAAVEAFGVPVVADGREVLSQIDAAIVATPTRTHHEVACQLLARGIPTFLEKPITVTVREADELLALAERRGVVLQVGHVERFNPAFVAAQPHVAEPCFIDAARASGYTFRSTDVGVVLDLMIHDLDLALALAGRPVTRVDAVGAAVFGPHEDWAQARVEFAGGCVANLWASRTSPDARRSMHVFSPSGCTSLDFAAKTARVMGRSDELAAGAFDADRLTPEEKARLKDRVFTDLLPVRSLTVVESNAILEEQRDFVGAIREGRAPIVSGEQGRAVLAAAEQVVAQVRRYERTLSLRVTAPERSRVAA